ncbi:hypothetical protein [Mycobacterium servetii]|uniref:Uncharacterized protein n=1 Tax=Mycobacterium servetii TaxID=3237418 RepID=A0ABV4BV96_9MYCO
MTGTDWQRWLARYGNEYKTDTERVAAFEDYLLARAEMREVFKTETP